MNLIIHCLKNGIRKISRLIAKLRFQDGHEWAAYLKRKNSLFAQGEDCYIDFSVKFEEPYLNRLGNNVWLTDDVIFLNHDAALSMVNRYSGRRANKFGAIELGNNVFIGMRSLIMPGIKIGDNVIIAAGSVVTKSIPSNKVYGGNPAIEIGSTAQFKKKWQGKLRFTYQNAQEKRDELINYFWMSENNEPIADHRPVSAP